MLNLNNISIPQNNVAAPTIDEFPTDGLKSILQNSDLLEVLLNPTSENDEKAKENPALETYAPELSELNFDELLKPNKPLQDHDYYESKLVNNQSNSKAKSYGCAFLGPNLWDNNEVFQGEKFGVEFLGIDEFLSDNNLNEADYQFLDDLQSSDQSNGIITNEETQVSKQNSSENKFLPSAVVETEPKLITSSIVATGNNDLSTNMKSLTRSWNEESNEDDDDMTDGDESKKFFTEKLTLQPTLKKSKKQFVPDELKDDKYWARRKKNNVAAKRSRDTRRYKENQIVIAATFLEHENDKIRKQLEEYKLKVVQLEAKLRFYESQ